MESKLSFYLNILINTVLKLALRLIFIIKNITHATQITKAAPYCTVRLEQGLGPGGWLSVSSHSPSPSVANILYAKWKSSMGNTESRINPRVITLKAGIYPTPERDRDVQVIKGKIKICFSLMSGKHPTSFTDCLMEQWPHNHHLSFVSSEKGEIFIYPH